MDERKQYIEKMQAAIGELEVKASLAKMELGDKKDELVGEYDQLTDRLRRMKEDSGEQFDAMAAGFEAGYKAFRARYDEVLKKFREP